MRARFAALVLFAFCALTSRVARSQEPAPPPNGPIAPEDDPAARIDVDLEKAPPPPTNVTYFQYGVAFNAEVVSAPGPICDDVTPPAGTSGDVPCVLGNGGGLTARAGWRSTGALYIGGAYELTKQDPNKLYRIALLQQARVEGRYYLRTHKVTEPYGTVGLGVAGYGNEWSVDTWGPAGFLGIGVEYQVTRNTLVGLALAYRLLYFSRFTDTSTATRSPGVAQMVGLELVLEQRDAVVTSKDTAQ